MSSRERQLRAEIAQLKNQASDAHLVSQRSIDQHLEVAIIISFVVASQV